MIILIYIYALIINYKVFASCCIKNVFTSDELYDPMNIPKDF